MLKNKRKKTTKSKTCNTINDELKHEQQEDPNTQYPALHWQQDELEHELQLVPPIVFAKPYQLSLLNEIKITIKMDKKWQKHTISKIDSKTQKVLDAGGKIDQG